jgi:hypothetical protein
MSAKEDHSVGEEIQVVIIEDRIVADTTHHGFYRVWGWSESVVVYLLDNMVLTLTIDPSLLCLVHSIRQKYTITDKDLFTSLMKGHLRNRCRSLLVPSELRVLGRATYL